MLTFSHFRLKLKVELKKGGRENVNSKRNSFYENFKIL